MILLHSCCSLVSVYYYCMNISLPLWFASLSMLTSYISPLTCKFIHPACHVPPSCCFLFPASYWLLARPMTSKHFSLWDLSAFGSKRSLLLLYICAYMNLKKWISMNIQILICVSERGQHVGLSLLFTIPSAVGTSLPVTHFMFPSSSFQFRLLKTTMFFMDIRKVNLRSCC